MVTAFDRFMDRHFLGRRPWQFWAPMFLALNLFAIIAIFTYAIEHNYTL